MFYQKISGGLTQKQAIHNLKALVSSEHFKPYRFCPKYCSIHSDIITVDALGGPKEGTETPFTLGEISDTVVNILDLIESKGTLDKAYLQLSPSEEKLRAMKFEEKMHEEGFDIIPLRIRVERSSQYVFGIVDLGFIESDRETDARLVNWYREITRNLQEILPYKVKTPHI